MNGSKKFLLAVALITGVTASSFAQAEWFEDPAPFRADTSFIDYGQAAMKPAPSTRVSWFTSPPAVITEAPRLVYAVPAYPAPPPVLVTEVVEEY